MLEQLLMLQGLGLVECSHDDESAVHEVLCLPAGSLCCITCLRQLTVSGLTGDCHAVQGLNLATRLHFEFYSETRQDSGGISGLQTIDMQRLDQSSASEQDLFCQLVTEYNVPQQLR